MEEQTYNGWTGKGFRASAYATWLVCLELVDADYLHEGYAEAPDVDELADRIEEDVMDFVTDEDPQQTKTVTQYAVAFLDDVNWREIAENVLSDWPES
jgi:hypothetical protein